ncbi:MAG TPA: ParB N-terminal domain-containing protein, partial [bacterium]|nr:ParB N-terminal domain-containing protein [bacterium]
MNSLSPVIQLLPVADLVVPDWNPRKVIFEEPLKNLMAYIQAGGKVPRILVWKGNDQAPWAVISGQRRREAFRRLGHTQVEVEVMDIPLEQAKVLAMGSNEGESVFWLDWDIRVEKLYNEGNQGDQRLSQADLADRLGVTQARVSYALKLAKALTPASRELIYNTVIKWGDPDRVKERPILELAALGTPLDVEKALPRVLEEGMTMGQVRQMVAAFKNGGVAPVPAKGKAPVPAPKATPAQALESAPAPEPKAAQEPQGKTPLSQTSPGVGRDLGVSSRGAGEAGDPKEGSTPLQELYLYLTSDPLRKFLAANLKRALGTLTRRYMLHALVALGLLVFLGYHGITNLFQGHAGVNSQPPASPAPAQPAPEAKISQNQPASPYPAIGHKPMATNGSSRTKAPSEGKVPKRDPGPAAGQAEHIPAWAPEGIPLLKEFGDHFFGRSGAMWSDDLAYFKGLLTADYYPTFQKQFFPSAQQTQMQIKQEYQLYS